MTAMRQARCWVCGSARTNRRPSRTPGGVLTPDDVRITDARYGTTLELARCRDCGFVFSDDPRVESVPALYEDLVDPGYEATQEPRALQMERLVALIRRLRPEARSLLDVGAGTGLLVAAAARAGLDAVGVEPSASLVEFGREHHGAQLVHGVLPTPELDGRRFDVVCLVDVIEHVPDPVGLLRAAAASLDRDGVVVVVTPDAGSLVARGLGRRWWHRRLAHVGYFDRTSLRVAAARAGLAPVHEERARWYFTVEYLAERVASYVPPLRALDHRARTMPATRSLYRRVVPLDLHDSMLVVLERVGAGA